MHRPEAICFLETKALAQSNPDLRFMLGLGYNNDFQIPSLGFVGGLWFFWNSNSVVLDVLSSTNQFIHCSFFQGSREGLITFAYVQPRSSLKTRGST